LGILPGSRLDVRLSADGAKIVLEPIPDPIKGLYGYLSGPSMTEALLDEREEERRREQEKCARLVRDDGIPEKGGILRDAR